MPKRLKVIVLGDGDAGRTSLVWRIGHPEEEFPDYMVPCIEGLQVNSTIKPSNLATGKEIQVILELYDFAGGEDLPKLMPLSYPGSHVIVLCYNAITIPGQPDPFHFTDKLWLPHCRKWMPNVPIILARTKLDLLDTEPVGDLPNLIDYYHTRGPSRRYISSRVVPWEEGEAYAQRIGAVCHVGCSAVSGDGIKQILEAISYVGYQFFEKCPEGSLTAKQSSYQAALSGQEDFEVEWENEHSKSGRCSVT